MLKIAPHVFPGFGKATAEALTLIYYPSLESTGQMYFDTATGEVRPVILKKNLPDPNERAIQVMQELR